MQKCIPGKQGVNTQPYTLRNRISQKRHNDIKSVMSSVKEVSLRKYMLSVPHPHWCLPASIPSAIGVIGEEEMGGT